MSYAAQKPSPLDQIYNVVNDSEGGHEKVSASGPVVGDVRSLTETTDHDQDQEEKEEKEPEQEQEPGRDRDRDWGPGEGLDEEQEDLSSFGIFSRVPEQDSTEDCEMPPLGMDYAFDFAPTYFDQFYWSEGRWTRSVEALRDARRPFECDMPPRPHPSIEMDSRAATRQMTLLSSLALPQHDRRHLLNLPQEILDRILEHLLKTPDEIAFSFLTLPKPWNRYGYCNHLVGYRWKPKHTTRYFGDEISAFQLQYFDHKLPVDPTCLRVCRKFHESGTTILYANRFIFQASAGSEEFAPDFRLPLVRESLLRGLGLHSTDVLGLVCLFEASYYRGERQGVPVSNGEKWMFDPFSWFLQSIGSTNVQKIKAFEFISFSERDELIKVFNWMGFIQAYCSGLKTIVFRLHGCEGNQDAPIQRRATDRELGLRELEYRFLHNLPGLKDWEVRRFDSA